jgi:hypothetical protein
LIETAGSENGKMVKKLVTWQAALPIFLALARPVIGAIAIAASLDFGNKNMVCGPLSWHGEKLFNW